VETEADVKMSAEEEVTVAGEGRAGSRQLQRGRIVQFLAGGAGEVGDSTVPSNMHPTLPRLLG